MRKLLLACVCLIGCGGSGGGGITTVSQLAGNWKANYIEISIDQAGGITGTTVSPAQPGGAFTGTLTNIGTATGNMHIPPSAAQDYAGTWNYRSQDRKLVLEVNTASTGYTIEFSRN